MKSTLCKAMDGNEIYEGSIVIPDHLDEEVVVEYIPKLLAYKGRRSCGTFWDLQNTRKVVGHISDEGNELLNIK